jgi:Zn-finger nucleic acid-binding protein
VLGACRSCAGVFAPSAAAAHLAQKLDQQMAAVVSQVSVGATDMSSMPDGSGALPCPMCNGPMNRVVVNDTSLDTCNMHGTWFDAWELERVLRARVAAVQATSQPLGPVGTRAEYAQMPPVYAPSPVYSAASAASGVGEGVAQAAVEVVGDAVASGALELAAEGVFAIITAIFD